MAQGTSADEYKHASDNIAHFQTVRFSLLSVFIAISAGLLTVLAATSKTSARSLSITLEIVGLATTILFFILHERTMLYWYHFLRRAAELEGSLGYKLYSTRPKPGVLSGNNAVRLFFLVLGLCWLATMFWLR